MAELVPGTLDMLILRTLVRGRIHGYGIAQRIHNASDDVLRVEEGSLYPALQRLLRKGWVTAEWGTTGLNRRARFYTITRDGRKQLGAEVDAFRLMTRAIERVLEPEG
jgi:PadR family transcriptional regulator PadR